MLFTPVISGWADWAGVFCDREAFAPLVRAIFAREGLGEPAPLGKLTPGTNAVFRSGDYVVKIFAPEASGFHSACDFKVETAMLRHAAQLGMAVPAAVALGEIEDRYLFRYLIMAYMEGVEAGDALPGYSPGRKAAFVRQMRALLDTLHRPCPGLLPAVDIRQRALTNFRLQSLPPHWQAAIRQRAGAVRYAREVIVHGDVTGENVLIRPDGAPALIDFADSVSAPQAYELAPLVFELFRCDRELVRAYAGTGDLADFVDALLDGVALHDFGADIIRTYAEREHIALAEVPGFDWFHAQLLARWS